MMNLFRLDADNGAPDELLHLAEAAALGALLVLAWKACRSTHRQRDAARCARAPYAERMWEGEGGRPLPPEH